ncbi:hypothetical protein AVEN_231387-1, partial [Araneus ventricosus]
DCIFQLATPVPTRGSRPSGLSTTNCEEKRGEGGRVHFTNPYVNKTSVYKGSKILRAARSQRVKIFFLRTPVSTPSRNLAPRAVGRLALASAASEATGLLMDNK